MKVGIEAQRIFRNNKHGMDVVALESIRRIQQIDSSNEYLLFAKDGPDKNCLSAAPNFRQHIIKGFTYAGWEQLSLPLAIKKLKPDFIHCTGNTAPLVCPVPMVLTLHDIIYLEETDFNGSAYQNMGNLYRKFIVPHAIRTAKQIITVSEFEKEVITERCPWVKDKLHVVHNGVGERFRPVSDNDSLGRVRKRYGLPTSFILFLGNTAPKKNTINVIKAYIHYCYLERDPLPIVITELDKGRIEKILTKLKRPDLIGRFVMPGYILSDDMPLLYNCASVFIYPSLRESFGLPVLEAMGCGVPVITSNTSALPEIAGDAALFIDPQDPETLANAVQQILGDGDLRKRHIAKGLARVELFSWKTAAHKLIGIYESIC